MLLKVICGFRNFYIERENLSTPYILNYGNYNFRQMDEVLEEEFASQEFVRLFGRLVSQELGKFTFLYVEVEMDYGAVPIPSKEIVGNDLTKLCHDAFKASGGLVTDLWYVKDNCADLVMSIAYCLEMDIGTINRPSALYTNAEGLRHDEVFTADDIYEAQNICQVAFEMSERDRKEELTSTMYPGNVARAGFLDHPYNSNNRVDRAAIFLGQARTTPLLPVKISMFMSILECLFTNTDYDITKHLTHRASRYYNGPDFHKQTALQILVKGYKIRSDYLHGNELKIGDTDEHRNISKKLDAIVRSIFYRAIMEDSYRFMNKDPEETLALYAELDALP